MSTYIDAGAETVGDNLCECVPDLAMEQLAMQ